MSQKRKVADDDMDVSIQATNDPQPKGWSTNLLLFFYIVMVILSGSANRVSFRLMQYSTINYSYFISLLTTFIYLPVNFVVILFKLLFTNDITPEMTKFPKWKFLVMGLFDSISGVLLVVGGIYVPGMMQNLLLQGAVPVTMLFTLLMLRSRGDDLCRTARHVLEERGIEYEENFVGEEAIARAKKTGRSACRILVDGSDIGNVAEILRGHNPPDPDIIGRVISWCCNSRNHDERGSAGLDGITEYDPLDISEVTGKKVVLLTDANSWSRHLRTFYSVAQYLGATVIIGGLVVSVWPAISGQGGAGPLGWDLVFVSATIPIALSGVYKEIAFRSVEDMDVWYLNGWVAFFQFLLGLLNAPFAAYMTQLPLNDIPLNLWQGLQCWLSGTNFITRDWGYYCSNDLSCGSDQNPICCDSCDGSVPGVSNLPAILATSLYMLFNIAYNVFLVLVIKHGSAALMYAASAVVLPLGAIGFTIHVFLGAHAQEFTMFNGVGLGIVIAGLLVYRFVDFLRDQCCKPKDDFESHPLQSTD